MGVPSDSALALLNARHVDICVIDSYSKQFKRVSCVLVSGRRRDFADLAKTSSEFGVPHLGADCEKLNDVAFMYYDKC